MMCGSCSNENAIKMAIIHHQYVRRGEKPPTPEDNSSCMTHSLPGTPDDLCIVAFEGAFHGRTMLTLSATQSKPVHKVDMPAFEGLLRAPFPQLKYPAHQHRQGNDAEVQRCLDHFDELVSGAKSAGERCTCVCCGCVCAVGF